MSRSGSMSFVGSRYDILSQDSCGSLPRAIKHIVGTNSDLIDVLDKNTLDRIQLTFRSIQYPLYLSVLIDSINTEKFYSNSVDSQLSDNDDAGVFPGHHGRGSYG